MHSYISSQCDSIFASIPLTKQQSSLLLALDGSDEYDVLADYISSVFYKAYGAEITVSYPILMGFADVESDYLAGLGIRFAIDQSPLFVERYLDQPAEISLRTITGENVDRHRLAEAGNLSASGKGTIALLLYGLACYLDQEGMSHILFTGTSPLKRYLNGIGLHPHVLTPADPARLGHEAATWGSYYQTKPKVMAGSVSAFRTGIEQHFRNVRRK